MILKPYSFSGVFSLNIVFTKGVAMCEHYDMHILNWMETGWQNCTRINYDSICWAPRQGLVAWAPFGQPPGICLDTFWATTRNLLGRVWATKRNLLRRHLCNHPEFAWASFGQPPGICLDAIWATTGNLLGRHLGNHPEFAWAQFGRKFSMQICV